MILVAAAVATACGAVDRPAHPPPRGNTAQNTRFANLAQLTPRAAGSLRVAWRRSEGAGQTAWETFPVVVGRTMYYTSDTDQVVAVDAATGRMRWSFQPRVDFLVGAPSGGVEPVSRGVAVSAGVVYELTYDDQLIALRASDGRPRWRVRVADPAAGYTETSPPAYFDGEVIVGGGGQGRAGARGFVAAYDARTGARRWLRQVGPGRRRAGGGGDVWVPPFVDPRTGTVYVATGNPRPAFTFAGRARCPRFSDATLALDARTGRLRWAHSELCGDRWDYDTDQTPMLIDVRRAGRRIPAIVQGNKAGFVSVLDARTGSLLARTPELVPYSRPHPAPTGAGVVACPGIFGGLEYGPSAYSPRTGLVYETATEMCMRFKLSAGSPSLDGDATQVGPATGAVVAIDPATGRVAWRRPLPKPAPGGALVTAGGAVLAGSDDGGLYVLNARTGSVARRIAVGLRFGSAPIAYAVGGREFVTVAAGGSQLRVPGDAPGGGELLALAAPRGP